MAPVSLPRFRIGHPVADCYQIERVECHPRQNTDIDPTPIQDSWLGNNEIGGIEAEIITTSARSMPLAEDRVEAGYNAE